MEQKQGIESDVLCSGIETISSPLVAKTVQASSSPPVAKTVQFNGRYSSLKASSSLIEPYVPLFAISVNWSIQ